MSQADSPDWSRTYAPTIEEFEILAEAAFNNLPEIFRARCTGLLIRVEDFADEDVLERLGIESSFDLMGLYKGASIAAQTDTVRDAPDMVLLFRRAILDYWADFDETLGHLVTHVLVHEIGHHLGLSDDDIDAIEAEAGDAD